MMNSERSHREEFHYLSVEALKVGETVWVKVDKSHFIWKMGKSLRLLLTLKTETSVVLSTSSADIGAIRMRKFSWTWLLHEISDTINLSCSIYGISLAVHLIIKLETIIATMMFLCSCWGLSYLSILQYNWCHSTKPPPPAPIVFGYSLCSGIFD